MPRIKELTSYTGALDRNDIFLVVDGNSFSRGMKLSGAQVFTMCKGVDGKNIELRNNSTYVQWRQAGGTGWINLVSLSELNGTDGKEVEIRAADGYIQWRHSGGIWANLLAIADLKGDKGENAPSPNFTVSAEQLSPDTPPSVNVTGSYPQLNIGLGIPKGKDALNPNLSFSVFALNPGENPTVIQTGSYPNVDLNIGLPRGTKGDIGLSPVLQVGNVSKTEPGGNPSVAILFDHNELDGTPVYKINMALPAGEKGKAPVIESGTIQAGHPNSLATFDLVANGETPEGAPKYLFNLSVPKGYKGETGLSPVLEPGDIDKSAPGGEPSFDVLLDRTEVDGTPVYKLNMTLPAGDNGKDPVMEIGTIQTGVPGSNASANIEPNGSTVEGNPKYLLHMTIPRGTTGSGSGNVVVAESTLESEKKYLFVPNGDASAVGEFVEYIEPTIPDAQVPADWDQTDEFAKDFILHKPDIPAAQVQADWDQTDEFAKDFILHKPDIPAAQVQADWDQTDESAKDFILHKPDIPAAQVPADWDQTDESAKDFILHKPDIPAAQVQADWDQTDESAKDFILHKPDVPAAQVQADWDQTDESAKDFIKNKPVIPKNISDLEDSSNLLTKEVADETYQPKGGGLSEAYKNLLDFFMGTTTITSVFNIPMNQAQTIYANLQSNQTFSVTGEPPEGQCVHIYARNIGGASITLTIPGTYVCMSGSSIVIPASGRAEISVAYDKNESKYKITYIN